MVTRLLMASLLVAAMACGGGAKSAPETANTSTETESTETETEPAAELDADGNCCCVVESEAAGDPELGPPPPIPVGIMAPDECNDDNAGYCEAALSYCE